MMTREHKDEDTMIHKIEDMEIGQEESLHTIITIILLINLCFLNLSLSYISFINYIIIKKNLEIIYIYKLCILF
jgi:hypothetical protein